MLNKRNIMDFLIITAGTAIVAIAVYFFMYPSHVSVGSATALAMVLSNFIPLPISVITFLMNVVLLILGFRRRIHTPSARIRRSGRRGSGCRPGRNW